MEGKFHICKRMAQDVVISILLYTILLFILKNWETTAMSLPEDGKNNGIFLQSGQATLEGLARKYKKSQWRTLTRENKSKYLKKLSEGFYKFKLVGKPKVYNYMLSKGWGAGGMPFNVLYTPNTRQQKILKSVPKKTSEGYKAYTTGLNDGKPPLIKNEKILKKHSTPRKYYSFIPHFFVSYGW